MIEMKKTEAQKRKLNFSSLDEMLNEARALLENGYVSRGNWTLGQACGHCADWFRFPIDGFPVAPLPVRAMLWVMKNTVGPGMKRKILAEGFKSGIPTSPETIPSATEFSDRQGVEKLQQSVKRMLAHQGPLKPSPFFGAMDKATLIQLTLRHTEHHFGFLEPKQNR